MSLGGCAPSCIHTRLESSIKPPSLGIYDIFGSTEVGRTCREGAAGVRGRDGVAGTRGVPGKATSYLAQWFQHQADLWDVDFRHSYWIDGFNVELDANGVLKKVIN